jgi:hypothetical protein
MGDMMPARKGCESRKSGRGWFYGNQVPFSPKEDLVQGKVEHAPRLPKGINTPLGAQGGVIHPSTGTRRNLGESDDDRRESSKSSRRWPRPTLAAMAALHVEPWRNSEASWGHQRYVLGGDDLNAFFMWVKYFMSSDLLTTRFLPLWFCSHLVLLIP